MAWMATVVNTPPLLLPRPPQNRDRIANFLTLLVTESLRKACPRSAPWVIRNICALVAHLHALQNTTAVLASGGDPAHGQQLFEGKGGCARCHAMKGSGSFIATDLSDFASTHNAGEIRSSILNPAPAGSAAQRSIIAVTSAGDRYSGLVRNENNTSLQIQDAQGNFYLLMKSNLRSIERSSGPQMPVDYQQQLGEEAIEDLVSYILREASTSKLEAPSTVASNGSGVEEATLSLSMDNAACKNR